MSDKIDIVFTAPPGPGFECVFVEVEDSSGKSIRVGEWVEREDGYHALRIDPAALLESQVTRPANETNPCPDGMTPDGPVCPKCGGNRTPTGEGHRTWVHTAQASRKALETCTNCKLWDRNGHNFPDGRKWCLQWDGFRASDDGCNRFETEAASNTNVESGTDND